MSEQIQVPAHEDLRDWLFARGVEFPCGGVSACGRCRVRVIDGDIPVTSEMAAKLSEAELAAGWRLACHASRNTKPLALEIEQWSAAAVLGDDAALDFEPRPGFGAVVDLGSTTVVVQVVNLDTGEIAGVETAWNLQGRDGADIMSRLECARREPGRLTRVIRDQLSSMLAKAAANRGIEEVLVVGNTAMHHLCGGFDVSPLCAAPFRSPHLASFDFELNSAPATFLGCAGGFVGSDVLAGILATGMLDAHHPQALFDLGTNGEIAFGDRCGIRVASTAAGPAFEAGKIKQGMRASAGAIDQVWIHAGAPQTHVIGSVDEARGICGSGLVDAVAAALDLGWLSDLGRIRHVTNTIPLTPSVALTQRDVRELQLAKAATAAGFRLLRGDAIPHRIDLAGAFGNYIRAASARRIGLLPANNGTPIEAAGNTALRGARMLLLEPYQRTRRLERLTRTVQHVELAALPGFQDAFVDEMGFP